MKEIQKKVLITSGIVEIQKRIIPIKDLINYINTIIPVLKKNNYFVDKVEEKDILSFFRVYSGFGKCVDGNIVIENYDYTLEKIKKHILVNMDDDLKKLFRIKIKYNMPIVFDNNIIIYSFFTNDEIQDKLKQILYYDDLNKAFLISLEDVSYEDVINNIIQTSTTVKKSKLQLNKVLEFKDKINAITDSEYDNLKLVFNFDIDDEKLSNYSDNINNYCVIAQKNTYCLEKSGNVKLLLRVLKEKYK